MIAVALFASVLKYIICKWRISLSGAGIISQDQRNKPFAQGVSEEPEIKLSASFRRESSVHIISSWLPVTAGRAEGQPSFNKDKGILRLLVRRGSKQHLFPSCLSLGNQSSLYSFN